MTTRYISTTGNDATGAGTLASPWKSLSKGARACVAGDTLYIRAGVYLDAGLYWNAAAAMLQGTQANPILIATYPADMPSRAVFNGQSAQTEFVVMEECKWTIWRDLSIRDYGNQTIGVQSGSALWFGYRGSGSNWSQGNHVESCSFVACGSQTNDHPIYFSYGNQDVEVANCHFRKNPGASIHCWHGPGIQRGLFANNIIFNSHWGTVIGEGASAIHIVNNIFADCDYGIDSSDGQDAPPGGTIDMKIQNNIFRGNTILAIRNVVSTRLSANCNCFFGNAGNNVFAQSGGNGGNFSADPVFASYLIDGTGDYHLGAGSPCIAAGTATYITGLLAFDKDGLARPSGTGIDIGPYEYTGDIGGGDTTPPSLSSPTGAQTGATTANAGVTTNEGNGTLYCWTTTSSTENATNIKTNGQPQTITSTGTKSFSVAGLTASTTYYNHFVHRDAAGNDSAVSNSASFTTAAADTTAPTLTSPTGTQTGDTTATGTITTNESNGTLWCHTTTNTTETTATIQASGTNQMVSSTGTKTFNITGLTPGTTYYCHYSHRDLAGNSSSVSNSTGFTTTSPADTTAPILTSPTGAKIGSTAATGTISTNEANGTLWCHTTTNATETTGTIQGAGANQTITSTGTKTFNITNLTAGTTYYCHYSHKDAAGNDSTVSNSASFTTDAVAGTRDPLLQPFTSTSIWNMPIGTGAVYVAADLTTYTGTEYTPMPGIDEERIVLRPSAPLTTIKYASAGWSDNDRCVADGADLMTVPMPADFIISGENYSNSGATFLLADQRTLVQTQPFARCTAGSYGTSWTTPANQDIYGDGYYGAHGATGLSSFGGCLRIGELRPGQQGPSHVLKMNICARKVLYKCTTPSACFRWPAVSADNYAVGFYGIDTNNANTAMKMGALLAIPTSVNISTYGFESVPGLQLAWTLQNYGAYIVDDTYGPGMAWSIEDGPDGSFATQFQADYGYAFERYIGVGVTKNAWIRDQERFLAILQVVDNNTSSTIGGGGTPLQALAPNLTEYALPFSASQFGGSTRRALRRR